MDDNGNKPLPEGTYLAVGILDVGPSEAECDCSESTRSASGPSQVNTNLFRSNWDRIFAKDQRAN